MNYLSHQYIARQIHPIKSTSPLFFAGNLLPDFLAVSGDGRLRSVGEHKGPLAEGVQLHLTTDNRFHSLAAFHEAQKKANDLLLTMAWETAPRRLFFVAHVLTEIALDAELLKQFPELLDDLYQTLSDSLSGGLVAETEVLLGNSAPSLELTVRRFLENQFLRDYATPGGCTNAVVRVCRRAKIPNFENPVDRESLTQVFTKFSAVLQPYSPQLLILP